MKKSFSIVLAGMMFLSSSAFAKPKAINLSDHTGGNAAIRSTLIPGWGQSFNAQQPKSYLVAGGVLLSGLTAYYFYRRSENTYDDYEKLGLKNGALYNDYEDQSKQAELFTGIAAAFWIYGITDAYFTGKKKYNAAGSVSSRNGLSCQYNGNFLAFMYRMNY